MRLPAKVGSGPGQAAWVTGPRIPTGSDAGGDEGRVLRLSFQLAEPGELALLPTVVTRESVRAGGSDEAVVVPRQVLTVAPMLRLAEAAPSAAASPGNAARTFVPPPPPRIDAAGLSLCGYAPGYKDRNQDSAVLVDSFLSNRQLLAAVFDGHGPEGHRVSGFARRNLPFTLLAAFMAEGEEGGQGQGQGAAPTPPSSPSPSRGLATAAPQAGPSPSPSPASPHVGGSGPVQRALWRCVAALDEQLAGSGIDVVNSGSTAALAHVHGRRLTAAWVGDSRLLLGLPRGGAGAGAGRAGALASVTGAGSGSAGGGGGVPAGGWTVAWSSRDHKPEHPEEAARIEAAGGRVARSVGSQGPVGPYRVWFKSQDYPGLAMSRALGDLPGRQIGITATPSLASLQLPEGGPAVLVLASDGVWELLGNEQVLELAAGGGSAAEGVSRLAVASRRAWVKEYGGSYIDDISALVIRFNVPPQPPALEQP
ncbi:hypothetical protein HYH03_000734 [Edaphochlamys debaryana]|uniref:PPM-type phosphatase domain-containing protein n=1 Tax=Edaphochlamys debaryana TaxID=47281 RepID=A0A835YGF5_9CHLO|nr:hypothetical protein HYH03_000734 [Edaphochlamys debaryana]|eukprot:KAG2502248.1 hypothetical protein HYH03_000734 [Edaphochlamys debaryana]